jgi:hypothetical protein
LAPTPLQMNFTSSKPLLGDPAQDLAYVKPNIERYDESTFGYYIAFANCRSLIGSLKCMQRFDAGITEDARVMSIGNEILPQFMQNVADGIRSLPRS